MLKRTPKVFLLFILITTLILLLHASIKCQSVVLLPSSLPLPLPLPLPPGQPLPELLAHINSFWLVETSGRSHLTPLEICSVESAALHHPNTTIYLLLTFPYMNSPKLMEIMTMHSNIQPRYLDLDTIFSNSPLSKLWFSGQVHSSSWPVSHLSDLIRYGDGEECPCVIV